MPAFPEPIVYHVHPLGEFHGREYRAVLKADYFRRLCIDLQEKVSRRNGFGLKRDHWEMVIWSEWDDEDARNEGREEYEFRTIDYLWETFKKRREEALSLNHFLKEEHQ